MPRASMAPPRAGVAYVTRQADLIRAADLVEIATSANLRLIDGCDLAGPAAALSDSFCSFAAGSAADAAAATTAETARWLANVRSRCADLLGALGEGEGTSANLDARRALRPPERGTAHFDAYAEQTWNATPRTNRGDSQDWFPPDLHDEAGLASRFRFLSEVGLPGGLRALVATADQGIAAYEQGRKRGRPAAPDLHRLFLFSEIANQYEALAGTVTTRGRPGGRVVWHRALIQTAAARFTLDGAELGELKALASWARGERGGLPILRPTGDELAKAVRAGMRRKISKADE